MKLKLRLFKTSGAPTKGSGAKMRSSARRSSLLTFLFFLGLSFVFWFIQSMQGDFTRKVFIPVTYDSVPSSLMGTTELPRFIVAQVQDKGFEQLKYSLNGLKPIHVPRAHTISSESLTLGRKELLEQVSDRLSTSAQVTQVAPSEVNIVLHKRASKAVPIVLKGQIPVAPGYIAYAPQFAPSTIQLYGAQALLDKVSSVSAGPLDATSITQTLTSKLALDIPKGLVAETSQVQAHIRVEAYIEHQYTLPIQVRNAKEGYRFLPLPGTAILKLTIPRSRYDELVNTDFMLAVDFPELSRSGTSKQLPVKLVKCPDWVKNYSIEPAEVQYVLEQD